MQPADRDDLKTEVAAAAARLMVEEGLDYGTAKTKAARAVFGTESGRRPALPDNAQIELELRRYLATFLPERHRAALGALRGLALQLMKRLKDFQPHLVGAVLNGTATEHSDIHLQLFTDDAKEVEFFLLGQGVEFEVGEAIDQRGAPMESIHLLVQPARTRGMPARVGVMIDVHATDAIRTAPRDRSIAPDLHPVEAAGRAGIAQIEALVAHMEANGPT